jgi:hypothetical protein
MGSEYIAEELPSATGSFGKVLYTESEFAEVWRASPHRLFVFMEPGDLWKLARLGGRAPKEVLRIKDVLLVTNG